MKAYTYVRVKERLKGSDENGDLQWGPDQNIQGLSIITASR
jgi:hypothetical protein